MKNALSIIGVIAFVSLSIGSVSADPSLNVQVDKDQYITCDKLDIPVTIVGNQMIVGPVSLQGYNAKAIDAIGFNLKSGNTVTEVKFGKKVLTPIQYKPSTFFGAELGTFTKVLDLPNSGPNKTTGPIYITFSRPIELTPTTLKN